MSIFGKKIFGRREIPPGGAATEVTPPPVVSLERQLEQKLPSDLLDRVYALREGILANGGETTLDDRRLMDAVCAEAVAQGVDEAQLREFLVGN